MEGGKAAEEGDTENTEAGGRQQQWHGQRGPQCTRRYVRPHSLLLVLCFSFQYSIN